jgi:hypothetical protein
MESIYCYVDESGQDTQGRLFIVAVVVSTAERRDEGEQRLLEAERNSQKGLAKWKKTRHPKKESYLQAIATIAELRGSIFYSTHLNTRDYIGATVDTLLTYERFDTERLARTG